MTPMKWIDRLFFSVYPMIYWSLGAFMIAITVLEYFTFAFHPLEKNIFLDQDTF